MVEGGFTFNLPLEPHKCTWFLVIHHKNRHLKAYRKPFPSDDNIGHGSCKFKFDKNA